MSKNLGRSNDDMRRIIKARIDKNWKILLSLVAGFLAFTLAASCTLPQATGGGPKSLLKEIQQKGELRVGYALADPHAIKDSQTGQWKGIAVEVMEAWAEQMKVKHVAVDTSWDGIVAGLQAGKFEVAAALNHGPARALAVTFSNAYMPIQVVLEVNKDKEKARTWAELDRKGAKIAVMQGTVTDRSLTRVTRNAEIVRLPDQNESRMALASGRVDAFIDDETGAAKHAQENQWVRVIIPDPPIELSGVAYAIRQGYSFDDIQALNIQIEDFMNTGKMTASLQKFGMIDVKQFVNR